MRAAVELGGAPPPSLAVRRPASQEGAAGGGGSRAEPTLSPSYFFFLLLGGTPDAGFFFFLAGVAARTSATGLGDLVGGVTVGPAPRTRVAGPPLHSLRIADAIPSSSLAHAIADTDDFYSFAQWREL